MSRKEMKEQGERAFKNNYWLCVLVGFINLIVCRSASGGSGGSAGSNLSSSSGTGSGSGSMGGYDSLSDIFTPEVIAIIVAFVVIFFVIFAISLALKIFLFNPIAMGCKKFFVENTNQTAELKNLIHAFQSGAYGNVLLTMFMSDLIITLFTFLLIIPGIIKSYQYAMVPYILADNPDMKWKDVLAKSKEMMDGHKWELFVFRLSFIGWHILGIFTCGLLEIFYIAPYEESSIAVFYNNIKY